MNIYIFKIMNIYIQENMRTINSSLFWPTSSYVQLHGILHVSLPCQEERFFTSGD